MAHTPSRSFCSPPAHTQPLATLPKRKETPVNTGLHGTSHFSVVVEGWRTGTHSYALVNQAQLREMGGRSDIRVTHRDLTPPSEPDGTNTARPDDRAVSTPAHVAGDIADVAYRIAAPFDLTASEHARRTVVFLTTEHHYMPDVLMADGKPFAEAYRSSDAHLVTPSNWSRDGLIASGADPARVHVVPHGVDAEVFHPLDDPDRTSLRREMGIPDETFVYLHVGAMTGNKGIQDILQAFAIVTQFVPSAHLILKGNDALYSSNDRIERFIDQFLTPTDRQRIASRMSYFGQQLSATDIASLYQASDAYVSPYRAEGFNMPVLEAVASGLPVIVTAGGPTDEFVPKSVGQFIRAKLVAMPEGRGEHLSPDLGDLVEGMGRVALDRSLGARARVAGPAHVAASHTWGHVTDKLVALLRDQASRQ